MSPESSIENFSDRYSEFVDCTKIEGELGGASGSEGDEIWGKRRDRYVRYIHDIFTFSVRC